MKNQKYVLIACEESQTVCSAFREVGAEAYSLDLQEFSILFRQVGWSARSRVR